jgi:hypothetical protein
VGTRATEPTAREDQETFIVGPVLPEEVGQSREIIFGERDRILVSASFTVPVAAPSVRVVYVPTAGSLSLAQEIDHLREKVKALEDQVAHLATATPSMQEPVIILRSITREEARSEIARLFQASDILDYGDIAEKLQIDLPLVVDICNELEREGLIGEPR